MPAPYTVALMPAHGNRAPDTTHAGGHQPQMANITTSLWKTVTLVLNLQNQGSVHEYNGSDFEKELNL